MDMETAQKYATPLIGGFQKTLPFTYGLRPRSPERQIEPSIFLMGTVSKQLPESDRH